MFSAEQLAVLVPTKDRPEKMREMLGSIRQQEVKPAQVVIVATGQDISFLAGEFKDLPIDYHHTNIRGQINQRTLGIQKLKPQIELVCLMDDDHYLCLGALQTMLDFWNRHPGHGAVCFNVINEPPFRWNFFKFIFGMTANSPGQVTRAGFNTRITHVSENLPTKWVSGGAVVWRRSILDENPYVEWDSGFPENEDVYFSFPLGKKYSYAVCSEAKAEHRRTTMAELKTAEFGATQIRRRFKLVRKYPYFSVPLAYWASVGQTAENFLRGILNRDAGYFRIGRGNIRGLLYEIFSKSPQ